MKLLRASFCLICSIYLTAPAQTIIPGGNVSGTWNSSGSPYQIEGEITVPAGELLTIEPGVEVIFQDHYKLIVNGQLEAAGTEADSIFFTAVDTSTGWHAIRFLNSPDTSHLAFCHFEYGRAYGEGDDADGGAVFAHTTPITVSNSLFYRCGATSGGGVYTKYCDPVIENNVFYSDWAGTWGGGAINCNASVPYIAGNLIQHCEANKGGGILLLSSTPEVINNEIRDNQATGQNAGGLYCYDVAGLIEGNTIAGNSAYYRGGGLLLSDGAEDLIGNTITGNFAEDDGGGIYVDRSDCLFSGNNISDNTSLGQGGGIKIIGFMAPSANPVLEYNVITGNYAGQGSGVFLEYCSDVTMDHNTISQNQNDGLYNLDCDLLTISNSIFWGHPSAEISTYGGGGAMTISYTDTDDSIWPGVGNISANPLFEDPLTGLFQLTASSPCIDAGDPSFALDPDSTRTDMGAFYYHHSLSGTVLPGGDVSGEWYLSSSPYRIMGDITVPAGDTLRINSSVEVIFEGHYKFNVEGTLIAAGTEIDSILFTATDVVTGWHGLRVLSGGSCSLSYCTVEHSHATGSGLDALGGGLYIEDGDGIASHCLFRYNSADESGGAVYLANNIPVTFDRCIFMENEAADDGGALFSSGEDHEFVNCTASRNTAARGGGIYVQDRNPLIKNTIVASNQGGGVYFNSITGAMVRYNDFNSNAGGDFQGTIPAELGVLTQVNTNGDSCDVFRNIFLPPLFVNAALGDYRLTAASPCIDAGDPLSPLDPDNTIADLGVFYYAQSSGTTIPGGSVSGVWDIGGSPYHVTGDIDLATNADLTIDPGVEIYFDIGCEFVIWGHLHAEGNEQDSILFTASDVGSGWEGLKIVSSWDDCLLSYGIIEYSVSSGINISGRPTIAHSTIRHNSTSSRGGGIYLGGNSADPTIYRCTIEDNSAQYGGGVSAYVTFDAMIRDCIIRNNTAVGAGFFFEMVGPGCAIDIINCLIVDNNGAGTYFFWAANPTFKNCTFRGNTWGIYEDGADWSPVFKNCIINGNTIGQIYTIMSVDVTYSQVEGGWPGTGNISSNPGFVPGPLGDYYLSQTAAGQPYQSPCVDVGDPASSMEIGTTRTDNVQDDGIVDMGYHYPFPTSPTGLYTTLTPLGSTTFPASGGTLDYNVEVGNTASSPATQDIWLDLTLPNGLPWGPIAGPVNDFILPAGWSGDRDRSLQISGNAPAGDYTLNAYVGDYYPVNPFVLAEDHLAFTKTGIVDGSSDPWFIDTGEYFLEEQISPIPLPAAFQVYGAYPNPFNPTTTISFDLPVAGMVELDVFDVQGRCVRALRDAPLPPGHHTLTFDGSNLPSGIYLYQLVAKHSLSGTAGDFTGVGKMVLLK